MTNNLTKPGAMVREERYIVIKRKDLEAASGDSHTGISEAEVALRDHLDSWQVGTRSALVIESDWPEYEPAWRMIEARINGADQPPAVGGELELPKIMEPSRFDSPSSSGLRQGWNDCHAAFMPHVAPLLAEIERLTYERNCAKGLANLTKSNLDEAKARIAELEAGQGEPVAWVDPSVLEFLAVRNTTDRTEWRLNMATHELEESYVALYRQAQPATAKLEMADVVKAHMEIPHCPVLTSNQCHALAVKLNAKLNGGA